MNEELFGRIGKYDVYAYTIRNGCVSVKMINFGCRICQINAADNEGRIDNIILGYDSPQAYLNKEHEYYGAVIGRCANIIQDGMYIHDNVLYALSRGEDGHHYNGGRAGFHNMLWSCTQWRENRITFRAVQAHKTEGYPGTMELQLEYSLSDDNRFTISLTAASDRDTIFNPSLWLPLNLHGRPFRDAESQFLQIRTDEYVPVDDNGIPTGILDDVRDDIAFRAPRKISESARGFDCCYAYPENKLRTSKVIMASLTSAETGRCVTISSNTPALVLSVKRNIDGTNSAIFLAPQCLPDAVHHDNNRQWYPYPYLEAEKMASFEIEYNFGILRPEACEALLSQKDKS